MSTVHMQRASNDDISDEDIKHLLFRAEPEEVKYPMYISKFRGMVRQEMKKNRDCHRTMGYAHGFKTCLPDDYLKKKSRKVLAAQVEKPEKKPGTKNAPVPKKDDWNRLAPRAERNYIITNIRTAVQMKPPTGPSRAFDTAIGRRVLNYNLHIPVFTWSQNLGKVPPYLEKVKKIIKDEDSTGRSLVRRRSPTQSVNESPPKPAVEQRVRILSQNERQELLLNMKSVWEELQSEFQVLPVLNDTPPKIKRKEGLEAKLIEIEKDIKLIEQNERIYVIEDPNDPGWAKPQTADSCHKHFKNARKNPGRSGQ